MDIKTRLQNVFRNVFDDESIELFDEMSAKDIEEWDSLTHVQLIVATEKEFKLKFRTAEVSELKNVGEFIRLIGKKLENKR
jgi:acyl carrier protein